MIQRFIAIANSLSMADFELYVPSSEFDIYHHKQHPEIELAVLRAMSKDHYHKRKGIAYFLFLDDNAIFRIGRCDQEGQGKVVALRAEKGKIYRVSPYIVHAAGPIPGCTETRLLILNPSGPRDRTKSAYPDDTYFPKQVTMVERIHAGDSSLSEESPVIYFSFTPSLSSN